MFTRRGFGAATAIVAGVAVLIPLSTSAGADDRRVSSAAEQVTYTVTGLNSIDERNAVAHSGVDVLSADHSTMTVRATSAQARELRADGHELITMAAMNQFLAERSSGKKAGDFPEDDAGYHNYDEMVAEVRKAATDHGDVGRQHRPVPRGPRHPAGEDQRRGDHRR
ncbi:MAG: hypothetical protein ACRDQB_17240 [Thermocrispum sp.]